jgi:hypothetical protein
VLKPPCWLTLQNGTEMKQRFVDLVILHYSKSIKNVVHGIFFSTFRL